MPRLCDYFVVCGLKREILETDTNAGYFGNKPPLLRSYAGQVLCHFPTNLQTNPFDETAIRTQCMPEGLKLVKNVIPEKAFHSLLITRENGCRVYGSVLTYYEPVHNRELLDSMDTLQNDYLSKCRIGMSPDESHFFNRSCDTLYISKCLCLVTSLPIFQPLKPYLEQLYACTIGTETATLPIESYLYNLLYEVSLPEPGKSLNFHGPLGSIMWLLPGKWDLPLCDYPLKALFEHVSLQNIIKLMTCVLLEQQILIESSEFYYLMLCAECITALTFPFSWPHVFVPILPASQHGFLDAPVPFIMGLRKDPSTDSNELDIMNKASLCSINLDNGVIDIPDDLPTLPDYDALLARLTDVLSRYDVSCPDLTNIQRQVSPSGGSFTDEKKPSIIDAIRYVKSISESPRQSPKPGLMPPLTHSSSLPKVTDHPIVRELQGIIMRTGRGKKGEKGDEEEEVVTSVSPTTGVIEANQEDEIDDGEAEGMSREWDYSEEESDVSFNTDIRMAFMNYFVEHFANYEHFSIMPNQTYQQWISQREQFHNFDKTAFLSDQPINHRPFYSAFLETTMFLNLIDQKLISWWKPDMASKTLVLFDKHVEKYHHNSGIPTTPSTNSTPCTPSDSHESSEVSRGTEIAPKPHPLNQRESVSDVSPFPHEKGVFPILDSSILITNEANITDATSDHTVPVPESSSPIIPVTVTHKRDERGGGAFSHAKFVTQLWRESSLRVKHMLGSSAEAQNDIEENTHIAKLCDLLERIWGHGLKRRESKSPLWAHLMAFGELLCHEESPPPPETRSTHTLSSPEVNFIRSQPFSSPHNLTRSLSQPKAIVTQSQGSCDETGSPLTKRSLPIFRQKFQSPTLKARIESILQPPPSSFLDDLQIVNNMREIKTDVGHARAWVRLALEKKSLSRHLSHLLSNVHICRKRYRQYAFLLTEDQKEQFLLHLLSLSAGDFSCFTTAFSATTMSYKVLVVGEGKYFGLSTACLYVNVGGENGESGVLEIPRGEYQIEFTCHNLGILTCIRLGHDNSGLVRSLMVEMVLVHCTTTGQTYRFSCGRWFARAEDDGSIERFIVGERVSRKLQGSANISALGIHDVIPCIKWNRSPKKDTDERPMLSDIKSSCTSCVAKLITVVEKSSKEALRGHLLPVLYGSEGFVKCLESVFHFGFKSSRKFQKSLHIWDIIERTVEGLNIVTEESISHEEESDSHILGQTPSPEAWRLFAGVVSRINNCLTSIGKDEKSVILFLLGLRDHHLSTWIQMLALSSSTHTLYEPTSFLRDPELLTFLLETMDATKTLTIVLEPLLVQGL